MFKKQEMKLLYDAVNGERNRSPVKKLFIYSSILICAVFIIVKLKSLSQLDRTPVPYRIESHDSKIEIIPTIFKETILRKEVPPVDNVTTATSQKRISQGENTGSINSKITPPTLIVLPTSFARQRGAYCLDGSPPAFTFRPSPNPSSRSWMVHLPGGGWCVDEADCAGRSRTPLGSSAGAAPHTTYMNGALSSNCSTNPDFCTWNMAVFLYCDGGSFLGNRSDVVNHDSKSLYMRGARVFDALVEYLLGNTGLKEAEQVMFSGNSAGGIGALVLADTLRSRLPKSVNMFKVIIDASMFLDVPDAAGEHTMAKILMDFYYFHFVKNTASVQVCTQTKVKGQQWRCVLPQEYQSLVDTPQFFDHSLYDSWQRHAVLGVSCYASDCPGKDLDTIYKARDAIKDFARQVISSKKNGVFLTACPRHGLLPKPEFSCTDVGKPPLQEAITAWMHQTDVQLLVDIDLSLEAAVKTCEAF